MYVCVVTMVQFDSIDGVNNKTVQKNEIINSSKEWKHKSDKTTYNHISCGLFLYCLLFYLLFSIVY